MATHSVICYPTSFLERNTDRSFLIELGVAGVSKPEAKLILYRIWADYGTSGSDRRPVNPGDLSNDRQVLIIEQFCDWSGRRGDLVRMAIESGFLKLESGDGGAVLVCDGFYPINSAWSSTGRSFQRRGAYSKVLKKQQEEAVEMVKRQEELFQRTASSHFTGMSAEERTAGRMLITGICRALGVNTPKDDVLDAGPMRMAVEIVKERDDAQVREVLLWMLSQRKSGTIPVDRIDAVLREWPEYVRKVRSEMD